MPVLKTTSPATAAGKPCSLPVKAWPSSSSRRAHFMAVQNSFPRQRNRTCPPSAERTSRAGGRIAGKALQRFLVQPGANNVSFLAEVWSFMLARKKFWLIPIMLAMVVLGGLVVLTKGSAVAPFIYTLF